MPRSRQRPRTAESPSNGNPSRPRLGCRAAFWCRVPIRWPNAREVALTPSGPGPPRGPARCRVGSPPRDHSASESLLHGGAFSARAAVQSGDRFTPAPLRGRHHLRHIRHIVWRECGGLKRTGPKTPAHACARMHIALATKTCRGAGRSAVLPCAAQQLDPAERVGFEPTRQFDPPTRFPVVHLKPLGHLSKRSPSLALAGRQRPSSRTPRSRQPRWCASSWRSVRSTCARSSSGS